MDPAPDIDATREQAALGLEQLASLIRARSWRPPHGPALPPTQAAVIRMLRGAPAGLRARRIAERLGVSAASLSDTLKALEARGWVVRGTDPADRRAAPVRLSGDGRAIAERLRDPAHGIGLLVADLEDADLAALLRVSQLLVAQAQRHGLATGLRTCLGCRYFRPFAGSGARAHYCEFVGQPFGDAELRTDCAEQAPADGDRLAANHARFRTPARAAPTDGA